VITPDVMDAPDGFAAAFGARIEDDGRSAVEENWIKPWPCCLMAHSAVEAAATARRQGVDARAEVTVTVHPRARRAAAYDDVDDGLQAKFSLPYLVAYTLLRGEPSAASFAGVDAEARALRADRIRVRTDPAMGETETVLEADAGAVFRVAHSLGSPQRPMSEEQLAAKVEDLAGRRLAGALHDLQRPVAELLSAAGLNRPAVPAS
jgi:2-methylcitrate dehydratase PrpD